MEKLALLTTAAADVEAGDSVSLARHGRHLYDIFRILRHPETLHALNDMGQTEVAALAEDIRVRSVTNGWRSVGRPEAGFASSAVFRGGEASAELEAAFVASLPLIYGEQPTFRECVAEIVKNEHLL